MPKPTTKTPTERESTPRSRRQPGQPSAAVELGDRGGGPAGRRHLLALAGASPARRASWRPASVPELQGGVIVAIAPRRATERVRNAVSDRVMCGTDPGWHEAVRAWEALDRMANSTLNEVERRADPDNWPIAGSAAELDPSLPEAELNETGEVVIGGQRYAASQRVSALRDLRGDSGTIALHLRPEMSLAQVRALLGDVRKSGATRVAVVARAPQYPWDRKVYWIADGTGTQTGLRPTDSLQLLLHAVDAVAGPGTIARVDGSGSRSECKPAIGSGIVATGGIYGLCDRGSRHCSDGDARQEHRARLGDGVPGLEPAPGRASSRAGSRAWRQGWSRQ